MYALELSVNCSRFWILEKKKSFHVKKYGSDLDIIFIFFLTQYHYARSVPFRASSIFPWERHGSAGEKDRDKGSKRDRDKSKAFTEKQNGDWIIHNSISYDPLFPNFQLMSLFVYRTVYCSVSLSDSLPFCLTFCPFIKIFLVDASCLKYGQLPTDKRILANTRSGGLLWKCLLRIANYWRTDGHSTKGWSNLKSYPISLCNFAEFFHLPQSKKEYRIIPNKRPGRFWN